MFDSIFQNDTTILTIIIMAVISLDSGITYAWIVSRKLRSSNGFFITIALIPIIVGIGISLLSKYMGDAETTGGVTRIATIAIALGLLRFRSNNGRAEEILLLLGSVVAGFVFGLGYVAYAAIALIATGGIYVLLNSVPIFKSKKFSAEKLLKVTIPETLNYSEVFDDIFGRYLKEKEMVGVKTTGMGSMFNLSYRVVMKNSAEEKEFIDELRTRNGNLEISILPYVDPNKGL